MMTLEYAGITYREGVTYRDTDGDTWELVREDVAPSDWPPLPALMMTPDTLPEVVDSFGPLTEVADA